MKMFLIGTAMIIASVVVMALLTFNGVNWVAAFIVFLIVAGGGFSLQLLCWLSAFREREELEKKFREMRGIPPVIAQRGDRSH